MRFHYVVLASLKLYIDQAGLYLRDATHLPLPLVPNFSPCFKITAEGLERRLGSKEQLLLFQGTQF